MTNVAKHVSMFIKVKVISMLFVYFFPFRNQEPIRGRVEENTLVLSLGFYVQNNPNYTDLRLLDIKILTQQTEKGERFVFHLVSFRPPRSSQCSTTGVTKTVVCVIMSV